MECDTSRYERMFEHVSRAREKLETCGARAFFDDYLGYVLKARKLDYGLNLNNVILDASHSLWHMCLAMIRNYDLGNDTWFTRMAREYVRAHPLDYAEGTQALIYSWMLFPYYFSYIIEDNTEDDIYRILYGRQFKELCTLMGEDQIAYIIQLVDGAFMLQQAKEVEHRARYDQMMDLLTEWIEETNCRLYELLLDRSELLDYQWLHSYQKNEKEQGE